MLNKVIELYRLVKRPEIQNGTFEGALTYSDSAVQLIEEISKIGAKGGTFKEILVDGIDVDNIELFPKTGKEISFKFLLPTNSSERFYLTIEDFATSPAISTGKLPSEFYVVDIDFTNGEKDFPPKLEVLFSFCEAIKYLSKLATYHDEKRTDPFLKLVFLNPENFSGSSPIILKTKITKEMLEFPVLEIVLLKGLCSEKATANPHYLAQIGIFSASLQEFLNSVSQDQGFIYLIENWEAFWRLYQINLTTFMSGFAFHKAKKEIVEAELKIADQFSKVINDITVKLLSIPVSIAAIAVVFKSESCMEGIVLVVSLLFAGFFIAETVFNQQKQLNRVKDAKNLAFRGFEGNKQKYPDDLKIHLAKIISDFNGSETYLARLLFGFRVFAWIPAIIACALFIWRYSDYLLRSSEFLVVIFLLVCFLIYTKRETIKKAISFAKSIEDNSHI